MYVLIVDDNDQSLYLLRSVLEGAGHTTCPASDGAEALACALKQVPDAVITDILMPRMDGFAFCRALREHELLRHLPVLLYSATYTDAKDRELGLALEGVHTALNVERGMALLRERVAARGD